MADIPTPEQVALARRLYVQGEPVKAILAAADIRLAALYRILEGRYPDGTGVEPARIALRRTGVLVRQRMGSRAALVTRMWRTAERQVEEIEDRLKASGLEIAERESNARTLAILARTMRELSAFDESKRPRGKEPSKDDDDDAMPRNVDDLRQALARKLDAFVRGRSGRVPGGVE